MNSKALSPQELAEQWCAKHPEVISHSSDSNNSSLSAMDKAVKIIALETSTEKGKADLFRAAAPFGVSFLDSIPGQPHPATDFLGARDVATISSSIKPQQQQQQRMKSRKNDDDHDTDDVAPAGVKASKLSECPYCKEPASRFCKETGRRHETPDEKAERRWKHVFRQLSLASSFVSNVRLSKKNSCIEDQGVELIF